MERPGCLRTTLDEWWRRLESSARASRRRSPAPDYGAEPERAKRVMVEAAGVEYVSAKPLSINNLLLIPAELSAPKSTPKLRALRDPRLN